MAEYEPLMIVIHVMADEDGGTRQVTPERVKEHLVRSGLLTERDIVEEVL